MSELDDERAAHEEIAEICFACGVETDDGTSVSAVRNLAARLSRYETAMREALRILGPAGRYRDVEAILRAALSDQPAEEPAGSKLEATNLLNVIRAIEHVVAKAAEAKCERRVLEARIDEHAKTCGDCNETNLCDDMLELRRWLAILDAQITPEPKGEI